jgi:hypothetical protein
VTITLADRDGRSMSRPSFVAAMQQATEFDQNASVSRVQAPPSYAWLLVSVSSTWVTVSARSLARRVLGRFVSLGSTDAERKPRVASYTEAPDMPDPGHNG